MGGPHFGGDALHLRKDSSGGTHEKITKVFGIVPRLIKRGLSIAGRAHRRRGGFCEEWGPLARHLREPATFERILGGGGRIQGCLRFFVGGTSLAGPGGNAH